MKAKRFRTPKLNDGELRMYWGKLPHDAPDIIIAWQGDSSMKRDSRMLYYLLCSDRPDPFAKPIFSKMEPSLIKELEARGYDITTLRLSVMKKKADADASSPQPSPLAQQPNEQSIASAYESIERSEYASRDDA